MNDIYTPHPEALKAARDAFYAEREMSTGNCIEAALTAYNKWMAENPRELNNVEKDIISVAAIASYSNIGLDNRQSMFNASVRLVFTRQNLVPEEVEKFYADKGKDFSEASTSEQEMAVALFNLGRGAK